MASKGTTRGPQIVALLAAGCSYDEIATRLHVSKRTIVRMNALPNFAAEVRNARAQLLEQTVGLLAAEAAATVRVLVQLRDDSEADGTRLGACRTLLDKLTSTREQMDVESRLAALESALAAQGFRHEPRPRPRLAAMTLLATPQPPAEISR